MLNNAPTRAQTARPILSTIANDVLPQYNSSRRRLRATRDFPHPSPPPLHAPTLSTTYTRSQSLSSTHVVHKHTHRSLILALLCLSQSLLEHLDQFQQLLLFHLQESHFVLCSPWLVEVSTCQLSFVRLTCSECASASTCAADKRV